MSNKTALLKAMPKYSFCGNQTKADRLDVTKSVPKGWGRKCWDIPRIFPNDLQNGVQEKLGYPKIAKRKKLGYPKKTEGLKTWDIPSLKHRKKMGYPKKFHGNLLPDVTKSGAGMGFQNGNRHFAKRISPIKSYH